jgi:hypothetical protein
MVYVDIHTRNSAIRLEMNWLLTFAAVPVALCS